MHSKNWESPYQTHARNGKDDEMENMVSNWSTYYMIHTANVFVVTLVAGVLVTTCLSLIIISSLLIAKKYRSTTVPAPASRCHDDNATQRRQETFTAMVVSLSEVVKVGKIK